MCFFFALYWHCFTKTFLSMRTILETLRYYFVLSLFARAATTHDICLSHKNYLKNSSVITTSYSTPSRATSIILFIDEIIRFGPLLSISSYPLENHLFQIKKSVRSGKLPLQQIINRVSEKYTIETVVSQNHQTFPSLKYPLKSDESKYFCIQKYPKNLH